MRNSPYDDTLNELARRDIAVFTSRRGLPDKPVLRDDEGQYSLDKDYAIKLRQLRENW